MCLSAQQVAVAEIWTEPLLPKAALDRSALLRAGESWFVSVAEASLPGPFRILIRTFLLVLGCHA